jgi:hypothetical protein
MTTDRDKATKAIALITVKATPTIILVEMTIATHEATVTSSKALRTDMEPATATATVTDRTTNRVSIIEMDRATKMVRQDTTRAIKSAIDSR